jgi:hypothetical protein
VTKHVYADLMKQYAEDATETDKPWERWQTRWDAPHVREWVNCVEDTHMFNIKRQFRPKPKLVTINGYDIYLNTTKPKNSETYYLVDVSSPNKYTEYVWYDEPDCDNYWFSLGLVYLNKEDCIKHTNALLSFTSK